MVENEPQGSVIEIRDPALDAESVIQQVQQQVARRRAEGGYGPDPAMLGPESLRADLRPLAANTAIGFPGLHEALADLLAVGQLQEPDFVSNTPLLGPFIVAARRLWNWMSTKWYVLPILRQQSSVNAQSARLLSNLAQWHELDNRRLHEFEIRVANLEARLATLEGIEGVIPGGRTEDKP